MHNRDERDGEMNADVPSGLCLFSRLVFLVRMLDMEKRQANFTSEA